MKKNDGYYKNASLAWLNQAEDDLDWTKNNIKTGFYIQACFTAQQVVEKALKAYLRSRRKEINKKFKTHQLINLLHQCSQFEKDFLKFEEKCHILNEYYAPTRYPEILSIEFRGYTQKEANEALNVASEIFFFVKDKISKTWVAHQPPNSPK